MDKGVLYMTISTINVNKINQLLQISKLIKACLNSWLMGIKGDREKNPKAICMRKEKVEGIIFLNQSYPNWQWEIFDI